MILIEIVAFVCAWHLLSRYLKIDFALSMHLACWVLTLILYSFARLGILEAGFYFLVILLPCITIGMHFKAKSFTSIKALQSIKPLEFLGGVGKSQISLFICILIPLLFTLKAYSGFELYGWDEFSHWAFSTKTLASLDTLPSGDSFLNAKDYPPGMNLFHYFFLNGITYSEPALISINFLLIFSGLAAISRRAISKPFLFFLMLVLLLTLVYAFGYDLYELLSDQVLAVVFGVAVTVMLDFQKLGRGRYALPILLAALVIIKPIGILFAVISLGVMFVVITSSKFLKVKNRSDEFSFRRYYTFFVSLIAVGFTYFNWRAFVTTGDSGTGLGSATQTVSQTSIRDLFGFFTNPSSDRHVKVWDVFNERFFEVQNAKRHLQGYKADYSWLGLGDPISISPWHTFLGLLAISVCVLWLYRKQNLIAKTLVIMCLIGGYVLNIAALMLTYGFVMSRGEAEKLASFERYLNTYSLAWSAILIFMIAGIIVKKNHYILRGAIVLFVLGLILGRPTHAYNALFHDIKERPVKGVNMRLSAQSTISPIRKKIAEDIKIAKRYLEGGEKLYIVSQDDAGYIKYIVKYELTDFDTNDLCWSLAPKYRPADVWSCDSNLSKKIDGYSVVYLENVDDVFWGRHAKYFDPNVVGQKQGVFKVVKNADGLKFEELR